MAEWECVQGGTILIPNQDQVKHLHIVLCDPQNPDGYKTDACIVVSVTTVYPDVYHDAACLLRADDHEFLKHESYVYYKMAKLTSERAIKSSIESGFYISREKLDRLVMRRVLDGINKSDHVAPWINDFEFESQAF